MADSQGPWKQDPPPPERPKGRLVLWLAAMVVIGLGVWGLSELAPGRISSTEDKSRVIYGVVLLALVASSLFARRLKLKETLRHAAIWVGVIAVLLLGYAFRNEMGALVLRVRSEVAPGYGVATGRPNELAIGREEDGHYYVTGQVNGKAVRFLVDTGASEIVLSPGDAARLGVDIGSLRFGGEYETANGIGRGAAYKADSLAVGPIAFADVPMSINQAPMRTSLLGMAFFKRLDSFEFKGDRLYLRWRG